MTTTTPAGFRPATDREQATVSGGGFFSRLVNWIKDRLPKPPVFCFLICPLHK